MHYVPTACDCIYREYRLSLSARAGDYLTQIHYSPSHLSFPGHVVWLVMRWTPKLQVYKIIGCAQVDANFRTFVDSANFCEHYKFPVTSTLVKIKYDVEDLIGLVSRFPAGLYDQLGPIDPDHLIRRLTAHDRFSSYAVVRERARKCRVSRYRSLSV